ncbi:hypothetical protein RFI_34756, partial [Reticulomyxa filosa]
RFIPRAEHVLVCNEKTTEEDVTCLIFRAITNYIKTTPTITTTTTTTTQRNTFQPLYCLVFPEKLTPTILDNVCQDVYDLLMNDIQLEKLKNNLYMFVIMSSKPDNGLCKFLSYFHVTLQNLSFKDICYQMLSQLYCKSWTTSPTLCNIQVKPWVQFYTSDRVAMGKSTLIQRDMNKIRAVHKNVKE